MILDTIVILLLFILAFLIVLLGEVLAGFNGAIIAGIVAVFVCALLGIQWFLDHP